MDIARQLNFFLKNIFSIRDGKDQEDKMIDSIRKNVEFRGANLWALVFAILIASIGLNINSIPIIIGAMLISPLMGPIVGLGLSLGINDSVFLRKSIKHISIATIVGISISTIYFFLSPIDNVQSELLARTSPTIYDVLIAFFGGLAGVVASTSTEKGNVIPGVAIATALMPPLCTVGYGLASGQPKFFLGALYLYAINCIFICLATLLGVKYLKLPSVAYLDKAQALRAKKVIASIVIAMIIPAVYFAVVFIKENNFNQNVDTYIQEVFKNKGYAIIYKNIDYKSSPQKIELAFLTKHFSPEEISDLQSLLKKYKLSNTELVIKQDNASLSESEWNSVITSLQSESEKVKAIEAKLASGFISPDTTAQILREAQSINNKIANLAIGDLATVGDTQNENIETQTNDTSILVAIFYTDKNDKGLSSSDEEALINWIKLRIQNESVFVYFLQQ